MATQTVEFRAPTGQTITAKLFAALSDTQVASAVATEATNRKGTYSVAYTDVAAGEYELIALVSSTPVARWFTTLTLTTATFATYDNVNTVQISGDSTAADTLELFAEALNQTTGQIDEETVFTPLPANIQQLHGASINYILGEGANPNTLVVDLVADAVDSTALAASAVAEIQSGLATAANQVIIIDGIGFVLAQEVGSVADAQTASAVYVRSFNNSTYTITHSGLTSAGVRGTASLVKS